jgi:hypothetical protein
MTFSEAWDRMFWSLMLTIFIGLVWMKFLQAVLPCEGPGLVASICVGIAFFATGWRNAVIHKRKEADAERVQSAEIMTREAA